MQAVAVARDDIRRTRKPFCKRADNIVRLVPFKFHDFDPEVADKFFKDGHLFHKFFGHRFSGRLVARIHIMSERRRFQVKRSRDMRRFFFLDKPREHGHESEDRARGVSFAVGKTGERVIRAVQKAVAVEK